jgi:hypothetical protein
MAMMGRSRFLGSGCVMVSESFLGCAIQSIRLPWV